MEEGEEKQLWEKKLSSLVALFWKGPWDILVVDILVVICLKLWVSESSEKDVMDQAI